MNQSQQQAVDYQGRHLLIDAGPGMGKTYTLIARIARIAKSLEPKERILVICFSNNAAKQIQERLIALDVSSRMVFTGTFDGFCLKLLRDYWDKTALPKDFRIANEEDLSGIDAALRKRISLLKKTHLAIEPDQDFREYTKLLRQRGLIDSDDVQREVLDLLEDETVAEQVKRTYLHVFVDDYQEINIVQNALLKRIAGNSGSVTVAGDPNQSVERSRGADVSFFHRFTKDFEGASTFRLSENFRNARSIVKASKELMGNAHANFAITITNRSEGKFIIHEAESDRSEADFVASQIERMVGVRPFGDIAIIYRLDSQRYAVAQALDHLSIPYQAVLNQHEEAIESTVQKVSLLTMHAAKGLEFPVVLMIGCEDKLIPLDLENMHGNKEEERRLFYVGMTRAKQELYLSYAKRRQLFGKTIQLLPSPFLNDIEGHLKSVEVSRKKPKKPETVDDGQMQLF